jgi:hypothetical protein
VPVLKGGDPRSMAAWRREKGAWHGGGRRGMAGIGPKRARAGSGARSR